MLNDVCWFIKKIPIINEFVTSTINIHKPSFVQPLNLCSHLSRPCRARSPRLGQWEVRNVHAIATILRISDEKCVVLNVGTGVGIPGNINLGIILLCS
jgi:hypothetical protein